MSVIPLGVPGEKAKILHYAGHSLPLIFLFREKLCTSKYLEAISIFTLVLWCIFLLLQKLNNVN